MSLAGAAVQGMRGADTGLKNGITPVSYTHLIFAKEKCSENNP